MADIILSSGYLGFARHIGFLKALEEQNIIVDAICGTSSGAIVGALYCSGYSLHEISKLISEIPPIKLVKFNPVFWKGFFSLQPFIKYLSNKLPKSFSELKIPLAVGVCTYSKRKYELIYSGDLIPAVVASGAVPKLFTPIILNNQKYIDAAVVDRLGLSHWKNFRSNTEIIIHNIESSQKKLTLDKQQDIRHKMIKTPRTKASLRGLKYFDQEVEEAYQLTLSQLLTEQ